MRHFRACLYFALPVLLAGTGCTHWQLRANTIRQSTTLSDIYTQQVLDNLAMFVVNPDALPFFAVPNQGTSEVQDTGGVAGLGYLTPHFIGEPLGLTANRQMTENWVLDPVRDPAKLALMRC